MYLAIDNEGRTYKIIIKSLLSFTLASKEYLMLKKFLIIVLLCNPLTHLNAFWGSTQPMPVPTQIIQKVSLSRQEQTVLYGTAAGIVILALTSLGQSIKAYFQNRKINIKLGEYETVIKKYEERFKNQESLLNTHKLNFESKVSDTEKKITALSEIFYGTFRGELKTMLEKVKLEVNEQTTAQLTQYVTQIQLQETLAAIKKQESEPSPSSPFLNPVEASSALTMSELGSGAGVGTGALVTSPER